MARELANECLQALRRNRREPPASHSPGTLSSRLIGCFGNTTLVRRSIGPRAGSFGRRQNSAANPPHATFLSISGMTTQRARAWPRASPTRNSMKSTSPPRCKQTVAWPTSCQHLYSTLSTRIFIRGSVSAPLSDRACLVVRPKRKVSLASRADFG